MFFPAAKLSHKIIWNFLQGCCICMLISKVLVSQPRRMIKLQAYRNPLLAGLGIPESLSKLHLISQDPNLAFNLVHPVSPSPGQYHSLTSPGQCHGFSASRCSFSFPCANVGYYKDKIGFLNWWLKHWKEMAILTTPAHWCWSDDIISPSFRPLL